MNTFDKSIFVNCPFDNQYFPILKSVLFAIIYLDYIPKISETADSGITRLEQIRDLIKSSKYSIHDISRVELNAENLPRFNMPLECGIDFGFKLSDIHPFREKKFLILDSEKHRYQKYISDISGNDIRSHENNPQLAIKCVRDWLRIVSRSSQSPQSQIWNAYIEFTAEYEEEASIQGFDPNDLQAVTFSDLISFMSIWITANKNL